MWIATSRLRRGLGAIFVGSGMGGAGLLAPIVPVTATAAQDPCVASEVAKTIGTVATSTGAYLDAHPQTNQTLTAISQQPAPQSLAALKAYFDANPQAGKDVAQLQTPLMTLSTRCNLPLTLPQVFGMLQQAQAPSLPSQTSPVPTGARGTGPLPGPAVGVPR